MSLEMRGLGVHLLAAAELALVDPPLAAVQQVKPGGPALLGGRPAGLLVVLHGRRGVHVRRHGQTVLGPAAVAAICQAAGGALQVVDELSAFQREPVPRAGVKTLEGLGLFFQVPLHLQDGLGKKEKNMRQCFLPTQVTSHN